jgi:hypothetical protein
MASIDQIHSMQIASNKLWLSDRYSPNNSVLVLGRVLIYSDRDLPSAYDLAKQIRFTPLWQQ